MKRFGQFLREREEGLVPMNDDLTAVLRLVAADHKGELMAFLDDLAVSDHRLRDRLEAYKVKGDKSDQRLPPSRSKSDFEEIVPSTADGVGGTEEEG